MRWILILTIAMIVLASCNRNEINTFKAIDEEAIQEMQSYINQDVSAGFDSESEIVESVVELLSDEYDSNALRPLAVEYAKKAFAEHLERQKTWPQITDCDRLDLAFAQLELAGIVCRQNFTCCGTCGASEIGEEIEKARKDGRKVRGYAFYHMQDTESAVEDAGLYLNYGATVEGAEAALAIANEIADALRKQQLQVDWEGSWEKRIGVKLDWKRRRVQ